MRQWGNKAEGCVKVGMKYLLVSAGEESDNIQTFNPSSNLSSSSSSAKTSAFLLPFILVEPEHTKGVREGEGAAGK